MNTWIVETIQALFQMCENIFFKIPCTKLSNIVMGSFSDEKIQLNKEKLNKKNIKMSLPISSTFIFPFIFIF